nr:glycosyltransferase family A protein [uncultured Butyrivibrio sp.]
MDIEVTVVIPTYNRCKTVERAIRSVYSQIMKPIEVIVVDDASTDNTIDIVCLLQQEWSSLRLFELKHSKGAQNARNIGIQNAKGNWIAFLDSDDEWLPEKLQLQINEINNNPECTAIFGDGYTAIGNAEKYRKCGNEKKVYSLADVLYAEIMFQSMLIRKDVLINIGGLDCNVPSYQEVDTKLRIASETNFIYISRPLFKYHLHEGETISKDKKRRVDGYRYVILKNAELIESKTSIDMVETYYKGVYERCGSGLEGFLYHELLALYNLGHDNRAMKMIMRRLMDAEFWLRYKKGRDW